VTEATASSRQAWAEAKSPANMAMRAPGGIEEQGVGGGEGGSHRAQLSACNGELSSRSREGQAQSKSSSWVTSVCITASGGEPVIPPSMGTMNGIV
jgi:hypothetical protein